MHFWKFGSRRERSSPGRTHFFSRFSSKSTASGPSASPCPKSPSISQMCSSGLNALRRTSSRLLLHLGLVGGPRPPPPEIANMAEHLQKDTSRTAINDLDGH